MERSFDLWANMAKMTLLRRILRRVYQNNSQIHLNFWWEMMKFVSWERDTSSLQWPFITLSYVDSGTSNDVSSAFPICLLAQALVCVCISCWDEDTTKIMEIRYPWGRMTLTLLWTDVSIPSTFSLVANNGQEKPFRVLQCSIIHSLVPLNPH